MTYDKKDIFDSEIQTHLSKLVSLLRKGTSLFCIRCRVKYGERRNRIYK